MQLQLISRVLAPSWLSLSAVAVATAVLIIETNWAYLTDNPSIYDALYGTNGVIRVVEQSSGLLGGVQGLSNNPLVLLAFALLVALGAAVGLNGMKQVPRPQRAKRFLSHVLVVVVWATYTLLCITVAVPFCLLLARVDTSVANAVIAAVLLAFTLHGHVIFSRLFFLKPRVFSRQRGVE